MASVKVEIQFPASNIEELKASAAAKGQTLEAYWTEYLKAQGYDVQEVKITLPPEPKPATPLVFDPLPEPEYLMSENQAKRALREHTEDMLAYIAKGNAADAAGFAWLVFKVARYLEWVQTQCPSLANDGQQALDHIRIITR